MFWSEVLTGKIRHQLTRALLLLGFFIARHIRHVVWGIEKPGFAWKTPLMRTDPSDTLPSSLTTAGEHNLGYNFIRSNSRKNFTGMTGLDIPPHSDGIIASIPAPHILVLSLNRPKVLNAMSTAMSDDLRRIMDWFEEEPELWCVLSVVHHQIPSGVGFDTPVFTFRLHFGPQFCFRFLAPLIFENADHPAGS